VNEIGRSQEPHREIDPLVLELSTDAGEGLLARDKANSAFLALLSDTSDRFGQRLGVPTPRPSVRVASGLSSRSYRWVWREVSERPQPLPSDPAVIADSLERLLRQQVASCLGLQVVQQMLDRLEREQPALVRHTVPKLLSPGGLAQVLRGLVREGVSIRPLSEILETLAQLPLTAMGTLPPTPRLIEQVRKHLAPSISRDLAPEGSLHLLRLSGTLEETLADAVRCEGAEEWLALPVDLALEIAGAISSVSSASPHPCALLTQAPLRRHVRVLLEQSSLELAVVTAHELSPELALTHGDPIGP
jgi:flagellar biosynthesis component FlhA